MAMPVDHSEGFLQGVRVLELADEQGEYCGKVLAGLGADVIKIEPPRGSPTRSYGPFYQDQPHPDRSLYFWNYNFGKRSVTLDLDAPADREKLKELVRRSDVLLETTPRGYLAGLGLDYASLKKLNPAIVAARITPFGDTGPYADYKASDLVHLALGGVMMNCGYDADPRGFYETPPVAPQIWQSYHIAGEMAAIAIIGALYYRNTTGAGQSISTSIHDAVSKQTEGDMPDWVYAKMPHYRQTCRHSTYVRNALSICLTKDGRWIMPRLSDEPKDFDRIVLWLDSYGMAEDLKEPRYQEPAYRKKPEVAQHLFDVMTRFVGKFLFQRDLWRDAQEMGFVWGPERRPEENLADPHWARRETFLQVEHPELGKTFTEIGAKWFCQQVPTRKGPRAPLLGEHTQEVLGALGPLPSNPLSHEPVLSSVEGSPRGERAGVRVSTPGLSKHGKPFALSGVRVIDLGWWLASAGGGRYISALGAEVIKVEHKSRLDPCRWLGGQPPKGGRAERDAGPGPFLMPRPKSPNTSGFFNEINAGKRAISLNLQHAQGKEILARLIKDADVIVEGYSPGTMDRMGFGYESLKKLNPSIVYVQQSAMGQVGVYGRFRSFGPIAAAFSGLSEMSGLPEPFPPAGIGYSFLDWFGGYNVATAIMAGLYYRQVTGKGMWIDSSQVETGTFLTGTAVLDFSANGRRWGRLGNRSPYKPAAPHGAYRCQGDDRWLAIACFTEDEWRAFARVIGDPAWTRDPRFASLEGRLARQDELDALVEKSTDSWDRFKLQEALQKAGVPAGVCQTAEDRVEYDPHLRHLDWMPELRHSEIGVWPVKGFPAALSETPAHMGGPIDRHGPCYGEDNAYVYGTLLGFTPAEIKTLAEQGVI